MIIAVFRCKDAVYLIDDTMRIWKVEMYPGSGYPSISCVHTLPYGVISVP